MIRNEDEWQKLMLSLFVLSILSIQMLPSLLSGLCTWVSRLACYIYIHSQRSISPIIYANIASHFVSSAAFALFPAYRQQQQQQWRPIKALLYYSTFTHSAKERKETHIIQWWQGHSFLLWSLPVHCYSTYRSGAMKQRQTEEFESTQFQKHPTCDACEVNGGKKLVACPVVCHSSIPVGLWDLPNWHDVAASLRCNYRLHIVPGRSVLAYACLELLFWANKQWILIAKPPTSGLVLKQHPQNFAGQSWFILPGRDGTKNSVHQFETAKQWLCG